MVRMSVTSFLELADDISKDLENKNVAEYEIALSEYDVDKWHVSVYKLPGYSILS